jgi:hypothetical protein
MQMDTMNPLGANEPHTGRRGLTIMTCVLTTGKRRRDHDYIGVYALYATRSLSLSHELAHFKFVELLLLYVCILHIGSKVPLFCLGWYV